MNIWLVVSVTVMAVLAGVVLLWMTVALRARRAEQRVFSSAERARIQTELILAQQQGRLTIIRELQELAVVSVARLVSRAEGARFTVESDPVSAVRAVTSVAEDARLALADLRRVMTVLREGDDLSGIEPGARPGVGSGVGSGAGSVVGPGAQLGLEQAGDLFRVMRASGLTVDFVETGERFPLRQGAELTIYAILCSALANALRFGGPGTKVGVSLTWSVDGLQLLVDDDGIRAAARRTSADAEQFLAQTRYSLDDDLAALGGAAPGTGISGMRERTSLFGGLLTAGPVPGVGFSVAAIFPSLRFHNGVHGVNLHG